MDCQGGTDSAERLEIKCPSRVSHNDIAVRTRQAGLTEAIRQWLMGLFGVRCVFIGQTNAVCGQLTSMFVIVEDSTSTNFKDHLPVICVTVATDYRQHQVRRHSSLQLYFFHAVKPFNFFCSMHCKCTYTILNACTLRWLSLS